MLQRAGIEKRVEQGRVPLRLRSPNLSKAHERSCKHQQHQKDVQRLVQGAALQMEGEEGALHKERAPQNPLRRQTGVC